jgi:hypothetical protein
MKRVETSAIIADIEMAGAFPARERVSPKERVLH